MIVTGIIVEYNPLHNGHIKHIQYAREKTNCDVLVAVMSGNFVQRGEPAIVDKFERTKEALLQHVDLVIELPFVCVNQSATVFANSAVELLKLAQCDYIVFGSEINDLEVLTTYANLNVNIDNVKTLMSDGTSYPRAYSLLSQQFSPNDILGVAYLKALKGSNIKPIIIERNNEGNIPIASATNVRKYVFKDDQVFKSYTPMKSLDDNPHFINNLFPMIKMKLMTSSPAHLKTLGLFAEGIENNLIKQASKSYNFEDFISRCISRRYTRARISRTLMFMLADVTQEEIDTLSPLQQLKVLGFNEAGQAHMRALIDEDIKVITKFKHLNKQYRDIELRSTAVYISLAEKQQQEYLWEREFKGPIIYKNNMFYNIK